MKPHKHAELIKAWADGAEIQYYEVDKWVDVAPTWDEDFEYRIKPEQKSDVIKYILLDTAKIYDLRTFLGIVNDCEYEGKGEYIRIFFDGETGEPKSAEVLK